MPHQDDMAAAINGCLNCRNIRIGVARASYHNGLRGDGPGKSGDGADDRNQSSF
jgi:hypothetical protein